MKFRTRFELFFAKNKMTIRLILTLLIFVAMAASTAVIFTQSGPSTVRALGGYILGLFFLLCFLGTIIFEDAKYWYTEPGKLPKELLRLSILYFGSGLLITLFSGLTLISIFAYDPVSGLIVILGAEGVLIALASCAVHTRNLRTAAEKLQDQNHST